jgi:hypothetical protein
MTTRDLLAAPAVKELVDAFVELQESNRGTELAEILTDDAVLDLNVPQWRLQVGGDRAIAEVFAGSNRAGFRTGRHGWQPTPTGAVVEYDGVDVAQGTYYRHLVLLRLRGRRISRLTIYCTGAWDVETLERQRREAPMIDDEQTGETR